jgi:hypothetical protein
LVFNVLFAAVRLLETARTVAASMGEEDEADEWSDADDDTADGSDEDDGGGNHGCCSDDGCEGEHCDPQAALDTDCVSDPCNARQELDKLVEEVGLERLFPPLDGTAFYTTICKINHSCEPNVIVKYDVDSSPSSKAEREISNGLRAYLEVIKDVESGEELVQSYIDQNLGKF